MSKNFAEKVIIEKNKQIPNGALLYDTYFYHKRMKHKANNIGRMKTNIKNVLNKSIYVGKRLQANMRALAFVSIVTVILSAILMAANIIMRDTKMLIAATVTLCASSACAYCTIVLKKRELAIIFPTFFCMIAFTIYAITGVGDGSAMMWTILLPIGMCYFVSVKYGIVLSVYYSILFVILFYTPLRERLSIYYTKSFMDRFPLLYISLSIFTGMAMYQYQKNALLEIEYTDRLNEEVKQQTAVAEKRSQKIEEMSFQTIQTLAEAIDAKDPYTNGHSTRVSHYSVLLAKELGWNKDQLRDLRYAAMVHDIGKIGIPDAILCRPTGLNDVEYDIIKSHTTMGYNILKDRTQVKMAEDVALYHHERYDGTGYPKGLKNVEIPDAARIVAIADAFDAMNSNRIYRKTCDETHIRNELVTGAGKQFDPVFVMAFVKLWDNGIITLDEFENEGLKNQTIKIESFLLRDNIRKFISYNHTDSFDLGKDEIPRLMESISSIEKCFSYSVKTVQIELELQQAVEFNEKELEKAMIHLEDAIDQSLRKTDIAVRYNHQSYIIVLVETISIDVQSYIGRIFREFFKINGGIWFIPTCQILSQNTEEPDTN